MSRAEAWIAALGLAPHPEGGWYRETWRAAARVGPEGGAPASRAAGTSIYYLLREGETSRVHRIRSDELWSIHDGGPLVVHRFESGAGHTAVRLSREPGDGGEPQTIVPAGAWFGAELAPEAGFALVGCAVAPGFEFDDLEMADPDALAARFPAAAAIVARLCRRASR